MTIQFPASPVERPDAPPAIAAAEPPDLAPTTASIETPPAVVTTGAMAVFFSTFITIFLAELGDKTQLTTLLMSAESHAPWVVFLGAGAALIATSLAGVWIGQLLAQRISPRTLETAAGILLLAIAGLLTWDIVLSAVTL